MKYLKIFENFKDVYLKGIRLEVIGAAPSSTAGIVQIDNVKLKVNGSVYSFEMATTLHGDVIVTYQWGEGEDFANKLGLKEGERVENDNLLNIFEFLTGSDAKSYEGEHFDVEGFDVKISSFSHRGGYEYGWIRALIGEEKEEIFFDMEQDATGSNFSYNISYSSPEDKELGKKHGLNINDDAVQSYLFDHYNSIT